MFAVPGWAITASPVQEVASSKPHSQATSSAPSKKRKNTPTRPDRASKVSGNELERLWNARTDSNPARSSQPTGKKHEKDDRQSSSEKREARGQNASVTGGKTNNQKSPRGTKDHPHKATSDSKQRLLQKHDRLETLPSRPQTDRNELSTPAAASSSKPKHNGSLQPLPPAPGPTPSTLTPLQAKMRNKLTSARFRHLNETLYTTTSAAAMDLFTTSPDLFAEYHAGFSQQVKDSWPVNPVDRYVSLIKTRGQLPPGDAKHPPGKPGAGTAGRQRQQLPLPRRKTGSCTVADLGCGDAPLARGCQSRVKDLKLKFHNFDLHASNSHVTKADIGALPLRDGEADIAVFCLSLMGTNWLSFVDEAWRILRGDGKGEVWVSEVKSRFGRGGMHRQPGHVVDNSVGKRRKKQTSRATAADDDGAALGDEVFAEDSQQQAGADDETDISAFVRVFSRRGFVLREDSVDKSNKMFVDMVFVKSGVPAAGKYKGLKWNGHEYQQQQAQQRGGHQEGRTKFIDKKVRSGSGDGDDVSPEEEAKVLKPCVYKTR